MEPQEGHVADSIDIILNFDHITTGVPDLEGKLVKWKVAVREFATELELIAAQLTEAAESLEIQNSCSIIFRLQRILNANNLVL